MIDVALNESTRNILLAIYQLSARGEVVSIRRVRRETRHAHMTVVRGFKRLVALGYIEIQPVGPGLPQKVEVKRLVP